MGTPLGPKYVPYTHMDRLGSFWIFSRISVEVTIAADQTIYTSSGSREAPLRATTALKIPAK